MKHSRITSRNDFPQLFQELGYKVGVEVGVHRGSFSKHILTYWAGTLYSIDPWTYQTDVQLDRSNVVQSEHDTFYRETRDALRVFGSRSVIVREFSPECTRRFADASLDFVYLDARHDYRSIWADLSAWYPKVKLGGMVAGHDYFNKFLRRNLVEVKRAVDNFFLPGVVRVTDEDGDNLPSWFVFKTPDQTYQAF